MIGIINALPMSLVQDVTTLIPSTQMVKEVLHREAGIEDAVAWLWGHANSDEKAQEFLRFDLGVRAYSPKGLRCPSNGDRL